MLNIINKSPFNSPALTECLRFITPQDVILLIEDGVYAAINDNYLLPTLNTGVSVYALKEDLVTRGITTKIINGINIIDYAGFVDLTITHHLIQTWP